MLKVLWYVKKEAQGAHTNCVTVCIFKFRGNVWEYRKLKVHLYIVTYCDEYLHIRAKYMYFYLKCCVLLFL